MLAGTAGLLAWGLVDANDGDDKHAILDTFSSWFGRGNGGEAESLREIESYDAINVDNGSGSPKETEGNDATNGENGGDETSWPTFSPTGMPSIPKETEGNDEETEGNDETSTPTFSSTGMPI